MARDRPSLAIAVGAHTAEPPPPLPGPSAGGAAGVPEAGFPADGCPVADCVPWAGGALPADAVDEAAAPASDCDTVGDPVAAE